MRNSEKLSDRALNRAIETNWREMLSASRLRKWVQRGIMTIGVAWAVALPLLNTDLSPPVVDTQALVGPQGKPGKDGAPGIDGKDGKDGKDGEPGNPSNAKPATNITLLNVNVMEIRSAPASKIWHRSVFDAVGDEFWALPDSSFKLKLESITQRCTLDSCDATFEATFDNFTNVSSDPYRITLQTLDRAIDIEPSIPNVCVRIADSTPYLLCRIDSALDPDVFPDSDVCLWLRRAVKGESLTEMVALEIRWQKVTIGEDRNCSGDLLRPRYEPE